MGVSRRSRGRGFTTVELIITVAIVAILSSIALRAYRDYTRRASLSEVVMATAHCKSMISENYAILSDAPDAGKWGCERASGAGKHVGAVQTSTDGVIRIAIANMDGLVNGQWVYLVPARASGSAMTTPDDLGNSVKNWICGSDWQPVRNSLPANCRNDTTTYASQTYE